MSIEDLEMHYKELNVSYGILEAVHRLRYEMTSLRRLHAEQAKKDLWRRVGATSLLLAAGIPAIYALLPDNVQKELWIGPLVVLALLYLSLCYTELRKQDPIPGGDQTIDSYYDPEDNPRFLSLLLNSYATRWHVTQNIVGQTKDPAKLESYRRLADYYKRSLLSVVPHIDQLVAEKKLSAERRAELVSWIPKECRPE